MTERQLADQHTEQDLGDLVELVREAAAAIMRGQISEYVARVRHAEDYTLVPPNGGPVRHGFDASPEALAEWARMFTSGDAHVELARSYSSGDLAVLVLVERQHGVVAGLPDQDWSLRVTLVFRRENGEWRLVHRHADPLVQEIPFHQLANIARGALDA